MTFKLRLKDEQQSVKERWDENVPGKGNWETVLVGWNEPVEAGSSSILWTRVNQRRVLAEECKSDFFLKTSLWLQPSVESELEGSKNGGRSPVRTVMLHLGHEFRKDDEHSQYQQDSSTGQQKQRLQSFFVGKINRLGGWLNKSWRKNQG